MGVVLLLSDVLLSLCSESWCSVSWFPPAGSTYKLWWLYYFKSLLNMSEVLYDHSSISMTSHGVKMFSESTRSPHLITDWRAGSISNHKLQGRYCRCLPLRLVPGMEGPVTCHILFYSESAPTWCTAVSSILLTIFDQSGLGIDPPQCVCLIAI